MPLLTPYPKLREDFEKWLFHKAPQVLYRNKELHMDEECLQNERWISIQPEPLQHFYLSLYAESVGYKIREFITIAQYWMWSFHKGNINESYKCFDTFPAAFDHFAQIREKELTVKQKCKICEGTGIVDNSYMDCICTNPTPSK